MQRPSGSKVAVIGAGISGLSAAYLLQQRHEVHLFEAEGRLGGHANTTFVGRTPVDTGFIVFNDLNYPHLTGLFRHLGVPVVDSEMSLSVRFQNPNLEWGGTNLATLVAQKRNLVRPRFWGMVRDILRFHDDAEKNLKLARANGWTLRDLLHDQGYGRPFADWYLVPMGAAIWSTPLELMLDFPAETFLQFCMNHRLLQVNDRPTWKTVRGGSINYVKRIASHLRHIQSGYPVDAVVRNGSGVEILHRGRKLHFDAVVFATHPPETLKMLDGASGHEKQILGSFGYQKNIAQLHSDTTFMPQRRSLWSAWNFHQLKSGLGNDPISLSYWMNRLQPLQTDETYIVSLNADIEPKNLHYQKTYEHPLFNTRAIAAQSQLREIQGAGGIYHCGAWTRYGFHEDGILSAVNVASSSDWRLPIPWMDGNRSTERQDQISA